MEAGLPSRSCRDRLPEGKRCSKLCITRIRFPAELGERSLHHSDRILRLLGSYRFSEGLFSVKWML